MGNARIEIKGARKLINQLKHLSRASTAKKILRSAATAAARPLKNAVKQNTPVDTGLLKKSIDQKVTNRGFNVSGRVGSNMAVATEDGEPAAHHLHLVEFGFHHVDGGNVPGQAPLRKGFEQSKEEVQAKFEAKLKEGLEREASK